MPLILLICPLLTLAADVSPDGRDLRARLIEAFPEFLKETGETNAIVFRDGTTMPWDDGVDDKTFQQLLDAPDLEDQLAAMPYPAGWPFEAPTRSQDPGRVRYMPFFLKVYGEKREAVEENLVQVPWPAAGKDATIQFNRTAGAAAALEAAGHEIAELPPEVLAYVATPIGSYVWRPIAGTERLSAHSFGIAVDFRLPDSLYAYWRWKEKDETAEIAYPDSVRLDAKLGQVVRIFEKHGFIWGGKWYHYDTMHFEYRPELAGDAAGTP